VAQEQFSSSPTTHVTEEKEATTFVNHSTTLLIIGSSTPRQMAALFCLSHLKTRIIEMLKVMIKSQTLMSGYQFNR